jgi:hypothetical protein
MNCREFKDVVHEVARDLPRAEGSASPWQTALAHAQSCSRCFVLLAEARALCSTLHRLGANDLDKSAPPHIESALRDAFKRSRSVVPAPSRWSRKATIASILATAAALALSAVTVLHLRAKPDLHGIANQPSSVSPASLQPVPQTVKAPAAPLSAQTVAPPGAQGDSSQEMASVDWDRGFVALPDADDMVPMESGAVVRVTMTRAALASLGLTVAGDQENSRFAADLLVDQTGTPRAIRFVY